MLAIKECCSCINPFRLGKVPFIGVAPLCALQNRVRCFHNEDHVGDLASCVLPPYVKCVAANHMTLLTADRLSRYYSHPLIRPYRPHKSELWMHSPSN